MLTYKWRTNEAFGVQILDDLTTGSTYK